MRWCYNFSGEKSQVISTLPANTEELQVGKKRCFFSAWKSMIHGVRGGNTVWTFEVTRFDFFLDFVATIFWSFLLENRWISWNFMEDLRISEDNLRISGEFQTDFGRVEVRSGCSPRDFLLWFPWFWTAGQPLIPKIYNILQPETSLTVRDM